MRILRLIDLQKYPVLLERGELAGRVRDDPCEGRGVAPVKSEESFLAVRALDEAERVPERVFDVFAGTTIKLLILMFHPKAIALML